MFAIANMSILRGLSAERLQPSSMRAAIGGERADKAPGNNLGAGPAQRAGRAAKKV